MDEGGRVHLVKWDVVVKPMELGGLRIGSLRLCKEALLAKGLWWFLMEFDTLWHKVIVSRHGLHPF